MKHGHIEGKKLEAARSISKELLSIEKSTFGCRVKIIKKSLYEVRRRMTVKSKAFLSNMAKVDDKLII